MELKEIKQLQSGPELDQLVAEEVMGWKRLTPEEHGQRTPNILWSNGDWLVTEDKIPRYSTHPTAAHRIVKRLLAEKTISVAIDGWSVGWKVRFTAWGLPRGTQMKVSGETFELAVCRAAIRLEHVLSMTRGPLT